MVDIQSINIKEYFENQTRKSLLRFITCGSVDDGKSTLIGRLLLESKQVFEDQLSAIEKDSRTHGTQGANLDLALLVDGLASEREQGITIDVAYRFFATEARKFIVADTPGHEQYTRNMATGASTADLAVILIDARKGILTQTRRHALIVSLLGIQDVVLAVNKMDLVEYDQDVFDDIVEGFSDFAKTLPGIVNVTPIPISAINGDNVVDPSETMSWYHGPTLLGCLETTSIRFQKTDAAFRLPVQWVNRPNQDIRGFCGLVASGSIALGDKVRLVPSGTTSSIKEIFVGEKTLESCQAGQSVMITLNDEVDVSRGEMICTAKEPCEAVDQFQANLLWMDDTALLPGRRYIMKTATRQVPASITKIKYELDINSMAMLAAEKLQMNGVAVCNISTNSPIPFDIYTENRSTGSFILIDRMTNATVGLGMIQHGLHRSKNVHHQYTKVDRAARTALKNHEPSVLWFTGLSGAGKSTIADRVEQKLAEKGAHTILLDGDNIRQGLNKDLGFSDVDRVENIRRIAETSKLMFDAGLITLVSFISPFRSERRIARLAIDGEGEQKRFFEIFVDTPLAVVEERDVKGLYKKARANEIPNFTGISSPYEAPEHAEISLDTTNLSIEEAADKVIEIIMNANIVS